MAELTARSGRREHPDAPTPKERLRRRLFHVGGLDITFCCLLIVLFVAGIAMMYSASFATSVAKYGNPHHFFFRQLGAGIFGLAVMLFVSKIDYRVLNSIWAWIIYGAAIFLLVLTLAYNTLKGNTMKRWIPVPILGQFQPSEVGKFALILILSYLLCIFYPSLQAANGRRAMPNLRGVTKFERAVYCLFGTPTPATVFCGVTAAVIIGLVFLENHLSCTMLLIFLTVAMLWVGNVKGRWFIFGFSVLFVVVMVLYLKPEILQGFAKYGYERIAVFKTKQTVGNTTYWQTEQSLFAIGSGGPFGVGFGNSRQKQLWLPEPQNDFIFAIIVEELGYVGGAIIILLFAALVWRGFVIATKARDYFGALLVIGIMMQVALQVILNIAVVTDTIPNTGIGLPFFSYGGTALVILLAEMGVVLSVSRTCTVEKE